MRRFAYICLFLLVAGSVAFSQERREPLGPYERYINRSRWESSVSKPGAPDSVLTLVGRWAWGPCDAVAAMGDYALIGNGPTLQILDMADPASPKIASEFLNTEYVFDVEVKDSLAFLCAGDSLIVLTIANSLLPSILGEVYCPGGAERVRLSDSMAYVLGFGGMLEVVDISNPTLPRLRGNTFAGGINTGMTPFAASAGYVFVGSVELCPCAIDVVDARNPDNPHVVNSFYTKGVMGRSAAVYQDTLLLLGVQSGPYSLEIYNVANPFLPLFRGGISGGGVVKGIALVGTKPQAYMTTGPWVMVIDFSDPANPYVRSAARPAEAPNMNNAKVALSSSFVSVAFENAVMTVDRASPDSLKELSFFWTGGWAEKIALQDTLAFIASHSVGLWIVDVTDVRKPKGIAHVYTGGYGWDVVVSGQFAYLMNWPAYSAGDTARGLWIVDISDIQHPRAISHYVGIVRYSSQAVPNALAKSGNLIFMTQNWTPGDDSIIEIVDVADPLNPKQVSVIHGNYSPYDVAVKDTLMFIASPDSGLIAFNVANASIPKVVGRVPMDPMAVVLKDTLAFAFAATLWAIDISDPYFMQTLGWTNAGYGISAPDLSVSGNFAYWADRTGGAVDVSDPRNPRQVTTFHGQDNGRGVTPRDNLLFYADNTAGIWIWQNNLITSVGSEKYQTIPAGYQLLQNYPNPFNGSTLIEFTTPRKGKVTLEVFNVLGQRIATLLNEVEDPGRHTITFSPERLSSGTYFYRLRSGTSTITKSMLYLK